MQIMPAVGTLRYQTRATDKYRKYRYIPRYLGTDPDVDVVNSNTSVIARPMEARNKSKFTPPVQVGSCLHSMFRPSRVPPIDLSFSGLRTQESPAITVVDHLLIFTHRHPTSPSPDCFGQPVVYLIKPEACPVSSLAIHNTTII